MTKDIIERFEKKCDEVAFADVDHRTRESGEYEFGYKVTVQPENDILTTYTITDWGNIKKAFREALASTQEERDKEWREKIRNLHEELQKLGYEPWEYDKMEKAFDLLSDTKTNEK